MKKIFFGIFSAVYLIILSLLVIYSYSQIDLNLTLSSNSLYQTFQKALIFLGYFNRPVSAAVYTGIIFTLFIFYFLIILAVKKTGFSKKQLFGLIGLSCLVLFLSYPAFSHDIFNYLFDARIVTKYQQNPYFAKALDYPQDLWTRFMHWTHRTYPYGPIWLLLTLPFSYLGFGKFVLTLINFKFLFLLFHLGNLFFIYKIVNKVNPKYTRQALVFYAFNPLIMIESIVSPHNEVMMLFFLLTAIYYGLLEKKYFSGIINLLISAGVKFVTAIYLPFFIFPKQIVRWINVKKILLIMYWVMFVPLVFEIIFREPYPWYFIILIGLGALVSDIYQVRLLTVSISFAALLRYIPYLYYGSYPPFIVIYMHWLFIGPIALAGVWIILKLITSRLSFPRKRESIHKSS